MEDCFQTIVSKYCSLTFIFLILALLYICDYFRLIVTLTIEEFRCKSL